MSENHNFLDAETVDEVAVAVEIVAVADKIAVGADVVELDIDTEHLADCSVQAAVIDADDRRYHGGIVTSLAVLMVDHLSTEMHKVGDLGAG